MTTTRWIAWFDRWCFLLMVAVAPFVVWLQFHKDFGHVAIYEDYARIIRAGLDCRAARLGPTLCPMWGYALPILITSGKLPLLIFQNVLGIFSAWIFVRALEKYETMLTPMSIRILKTMIVLSLPLYAFNSMLGPQSVAANLLVLSFAALATRVSAQVVPIWRVVVSGLLFGLMLNFRSDAYLLPLGLGLVFLLVKRFSAPATGRVAVWIGCIALMLTPWAFYTKSVTGHYLLTSTNSGHVSFVGLGGRPGNKWGITPHDLDPQLLEIAGQCSGKDKRSCGYEGNALLRKAWRRRVREDPLEYLRGCAYSLGHMIVGGVYAGNFDPEFGGKIKVLLAHKSLRDIIRDDPLIWADYLNVRVALNLLSDITGRLVVLSAFALFAFALRAAIRSRNWPTLLMCAAIAYQWSINVFVSNMRSYMSSMYLFYLAIIVCGWTALRRRPSGPIQEPGSVRADSASRNIEAATEHPG